MICYKARELNSLSSGTLCGFKLQSRRCYYMKPLLHCTVLFCWETTLQPASCRIGRATVEFLIQFRASWVWSVANIVMQKHQRSSFHLISSCKFQILIIGWPLSRFITNLQENAVPQSFSVFCSKEMKIWAQNSNSGVALLTSFPALIEASISTWNQNAIK